VVADERDAFREQEHRGLVLPPRGAAQLADQMKNAVSAINAGYNAPKRGKENASSAPAEPEPSVHVTIGRIEVRATSENRPVSRSGAASPVISLEEYLHRSAQRGSQ
jgi:hypothetical protein